MGRLETALDKWDRELQRTVELIQQVKEISRWEQSQHESPARSAEKTEETTRVTTLPDTQMAEPCATPVDTSRSPAVSL